MTDIEKEQIAAEIIACFEGHGILPKPGNPYWITGEACALGAPSVVVHGREKCSLDILSDTETASRYFADIFEVPYRFATGVWQAFDQCGGAPGEIYDEHYADGYDVGNIVRAAMLETP